MHIPIEADTWSAICCCCCSRHLLRLWWHSSSIYSDFSYISVDSLNHFKLWIFLWACINIKLLFRAFSVLNLKLQAPRVNSFVSVTTVSFVSEMGIFFHLFSGGDSLQSRNREIEKQRQVSTSNRVHNADILWYYLLLFCRLFFSYFKCFFSLGLSWVWVMIVSFVRLFTSLETRPSLNR